MKMVERTKEAVYAFIHTWWTLDALYHRARAAIGFNMVIFALKHMLL